MILSDRSIRDQLEQGFLVIDPPPGDSAIQPASVDLTLGNSFRSPYADQPFTITDGIYYTLVPGETMLATTNEHVEIPSMMAARVEGKSSFGRQFLMVHATAGFVDPGFKGQITLELANLSKVAIPLTIGAPICQISFTWTDFPVDRPYGSEGLGSHYQNQVGATASPSPWG